MHDTHHVMQNLGVFMPSDWRPAVIENVRSFGKWKDFVRENFPWLEHRNHSVGDFHAEVSARRFGDGELSTISATESEVIRTRHLSEIAEMGFLKLMWQIRGRVHLEQDGREAMLQPGQATVCDTARPYRIRVFDDSLFAVFMMPYDACPGWEQISHKLCGSRLIEGASIRAAIGSLMALTSTDDPSNDDETRLVIKAVQSMITATLHRSASAQGLTEYRDPRLYKAHQYILSRIANPELSVDDVAAALCMSRRSLYTLFKECDTTPARLMQEIRLEQSMRLLSDRTQNSRKITDIAFDNGFNDYATFSRLFKQRYGVTPSEFRLRARLSTH